MVLKDSEKKECQIRELSFIIGLFFLVESTAIGSLSKCTVKRIKVEKNIGYSLRNHFVWTFLSYHMKKYIKIHFCDYESRETRYILYAKITSIV